MRYEFYFEFTTVSCNFRCCSIKLQETALILAAVEGHVDMVQLLLTTGASINSKDYVFDLFHFTDFSSAPLFSSFVLDLNLLYIDVLWQNS